MRRIIMARGILAIFISLGYGVAPTILRALEVSPDCDLPDVKRFMAQLRPICRMGPEPQVGAPRGR